MKLQPGPAIEKYYKECSQKIFETLKELFEKKHLYQSLNVETNKIFSDILENVEVRFQSHFLEFVKNRIKPLWYSHDNAEYKPFSPTETISFHTPDIKNFCSTCDRIEPYTSISSYDFLDHQRSSEYYQIDAKKPSQLFAFSFQCQSCKGIPEVFLIRREGKKLTLCGRSPIEFVDVPKTIPKEIRCYYSGAIVAHQSGQTLAGNFLLRTMLEQWAILYVKTPGLKADGTIDKYMELLPGDFKARFPSFKLLYSDLSLDIHTAKGDSELFEKSVTQINKHFDALRLYEITVSS